MKVQDRQNGPLKSFRVYQKKLAGYAPNSLTPIEQISESREQMAKSATKHSFFKG